MRSITIEFPTPENNYFTVREGEKYNDGLCWNEMLEQIIGITHPDIKKERYSMHTKRFLDADKAYKQAHRDLIIASEAEWLLSQEAEVAS